MICSGLLRSGRKSWNKGKPLRYIAAAYTSEQKDIDDVVGMCKRENLNEVTRTTRWVYRGAFANRVVKD